MTDASAELQWSRNVALHRKLLLYAGSIYLLWYFIVQLVIPDAFNPIASRLFVSALCIGIAITSRYSAFLLKHLRPLALACVWLITLHFYYLFYFNAGDINWIVGCYITVIAVSLCLFSNSAIHWFSFLNVICAGVLLYLLPHLRSSVFAPGLFTILIQSNVGTYAYNSTLKNLVESNLRFQTLFNSAFESILVHEQGKIVDVNDTLTANFGFKREELIGKSVLDVVAPSARANVASKLKLDEPPLYETKGLTKDGREIDLEVQGKNIVYNGKPSRLVTINDITSRKKIEAQRIAALTLTENVRIRDEFISIASHELKTPISALKLQSDLIDRDFRRGGVDVAEKLPGVLTLFNRQIDRLAELVNTMLDVSRISSGRFTIEPAPLELAGLVREIVKAQKLLNQAIDIRFDGPESLTLTGDRRRLEQVVENLLNNAVKYGEGRPVRLLLKQDGANAALTVSDQGLGISPEFIPRIFERFERAISARNITGLGLGLYITKQIVDSHGGSISAESRPGGGSSFTVSLPIS